MDALVMWGDDFNYLPLKMIFAVVEKPEFTG
jgi:hypothetical protein